MFCFPILARDNQHPAMAAAGHGFLYPSMWGSSHGSGVSFGNPTSNGSGHHPTSTNSQMPTLSPTSTSNAKENRDTNTFEPPHPSPPNSGSSSSPYHSGYPASPSKCDVKASVHNIKCENNFSSRTDITPRDNFKPQHQRKSHRTADDPEYANRTESSPIAEYSPTNNNNHFDSDKEEIANPHNGGEIGYESNSRHPNYHYHNQDNPVSSSHNGSSSSAYSGHSISGQQGNSSASGHHLMKQRPEGTNNTSSRHERRNENGDSGSFSPVPENESHIPLSPYNTSSINSTLGVYPTYLSSSHQPNPHQTSSLSSPLYGSYSTCGSLFASSKSFHSNPSSSSKSKSIKNKSSSSGKNHKERKENFLSAQSIFFVLCMI